MPFFKIDIPDNDKNWLNTVFLGLFAITLKFAGKQAWTFWMWLFGYYQKTKDIPVEIMTTRKHVFRYSVVMLFGFTLISIITALLFRR